MVVERELVTCLSHHEIILLIEVWAEHKELICLRGECGESCPDVRDLRERHRGEKTCVQWSSWWSPFNDPECVSISGYLH